MSGAVEFVQPDWRLPRVRVLSTTRGGGVSQGAYASLNLALHVGDDQHAVTENRRRLRGVAAWSGDRLRLMVINGTAWRVTRSSAR